MLAHSYRLAIRRPGCFAGDSSVRSDSRPLLATRAEAADAGHHQGEFGEATRAGEESVYRSERLFDGLVDPKVLATWPKFSQTFAPFEADESFCF